MGSQNPLQTGDNITYDKLYYFYSENRFKISLENFVRGLAVFELKVYTFHVNIYKIIELSQLFYPCSDDVILVPVLFSSLGNEKTLLQQFFAACCGKNPFPSTTIETLP